MQIHLLLHKVGFSSNESRIYLASLETGLASAQDIARKAGVKRTTGYSVLASLVSRGVVGKTKVRGRTRFLAEPPQRLLTLLTELEQGITEAMPELTAIYNKNEAKPKITFYEGEGAVWNVYLDTLKEKPSVILMWNNQEFFDKFKGNNYIPQRVALGIGAKRIAPKGSTWDLVNRHRDDKELSETLIVPKSVFDPHIEVNIYNNKVAFLNYAENMSVIIESKPIADAMRQAYHLSWLGAQQISTNKPSR
jgi:sugar-specific transcriptional regulator TrmB